MGLIGVYVLLVAAGEALGLGLTWIADKFVPDFSMAIGTALFFAILCLAWPIAVRMVPDREG